MSPRQIHEQAVKDLLRQSPPKRRRAPLRCVNLFCQDCQQTRFYRRVRRALSKLRCSVCNHTNCLIPPSAGNVDPVEKAHWDREAALKTQRREARALG